MSEARITVSHHEDETELTTLCSPHVAYVGVYVDAEITYRPGCIADAIAAVDRLAADLRRQIADAAESPTQEDA